LIFVALACLAPMRVRAAQQKPGGSIPAPLGVTFAPIHALTPKPAKKPGENGQSCVGNCRFSEGLNRLFSVLAADGPGSQTARRPDFTCVGSACAQPPATRQIGNLPTFFTCPWSVVNGGEGYAARADLYSPLTASEARHWWLVVGKQASVEGGLYSPSL
jgi:hypothetical protein